MKKYTEDNLKYIQEKIEQGLELECSVNENDTFKLINPKRCSDYMMEKFDKFKVALFNRWISVDHEVDLMKKFLATRFVIIKDKIEFPELISLEQVGKIIDTYQFETKEIMYNPSNEHIEIFVKEGI